jgi:hypothetical protein
LPSTTTFSLVNLLAVGDLKREKAMIRVFAILFFVSIGHPSLAAFVSADDLRKDCNAKLGQTDANFERCLWYIAAIKDAMQDAGPIRGARACFPGTLIVGNLIRPVVEFIDRLKADPKTIGAGGTVILALAAAYPCSAEQTAEKPNATRKLAMTDLRPNMELHVGKTVETSGFIRCLVRMDDCQVEPDAFSSGLMPYLTFQAGALPPTKRSEFYAKCKSLCFFSGVVTVTKDYDVRIRPVDVTFETLAEHMK